MFVNRRSFLSLQIEDMREEQAANVASSIRAHLYSLLESLVAESPSSSSAPPAPPEMREFGRAGSKIQQVVVPVTRPPMTLLEWLDRSVEERRRFLATTVLGIEASTFLELIPSGASQSDYFSLFHLSILFTFSDPRCRLSRLDLASLVVTHAYCVLTLCRSYEGYRKLLLDNSNGVNDVSEAAPIGSGCSSSTVDLAHSIRLASASQLTSIKERFSQYIADKFRNKLRLDYVHGTAQWQAVFQTLSWLNRLLRSPYANPDPALLYNGTLAATLHGDLRSRSDWRKFVAEELFQGTEVGRTVLTLFDRLADRCGRTEAKDMEECRHEKKKKKKSNKKMKKDSEESKEESERDDEEVEDEDDVWIDENNKFSQLCLIQS